MALLRPHMAWGQNVLPSPGRTGTVQAMPYVRSERMALAIRLPSYPLSRFVRRVPRRANMQVSSLHKYRVPARLHRRTPVRHRAHPHRMWNTVLTPSGSRRSWPYRMATRHLCECNRTELPPSLLVLCCRLGTRLFLLAHLAAVRSCGGALLSSLLPGERRRPKASAIVSHECMLPPLHNALCARDVALAHVGHG